MDIVVNSVRVGKGNRLIDLAETIEAGQGRAPDTLESLKKLANALKGDANYFQTVATAIGNTADKSMTYIKTPVAFLFDAKVDDVGMTNYATTATTYQKQIVFINSKASTTCLLKHGDR